MQIIGLILSVAVMFQTPEPPYPTVTPGSWWGAETALPLCTAQPDNTNTPNPLIETVVLETVDLSTPGPNTTPTATQTATPQPTATLQPTAAPTGGYITEPLSPYLYDAGGGFTCWSKEGSPNLLNRKIAAVWAHGAGQWSYPNNFYYQFTGWVISFQTSSGASWGWSMQTEEGRNDLVNDLYQFAGFPLMINPLEHNTLGYNLQDNSLAWGCIAGAVYEGNIMFWDDAYTPPTAVPIITPTGTPSCRTPEPAPMPFEPPYIDFDPLRDCMVLFPDISVSIPEISFPPIGTIWEGGDVGISGLRLCIKWLHVGGQLFGMSIEVLLSALAGVGGVKMILDTIR